MHSGTPGARQIVALRYYMAQVDTRWSVALRDCNLRSTCKADRRLCFQLDLHSRGNLGLLWHTSATYIPSCRAQQAA